uniref:Ribonuclease P/MRP subunit p30 n=1 Tax=Podarcis muralis TaxID=64176 RepID=A0A670HPU9_PODMU
IVLRNVLGANVGLSRPVLRGLGFCFTPFPHGCFSSSLQGKSKPIKILSRLTLVVSDPSHCNILRSTSTNIKFYDIFAVFPKSGKLFHAIDRGIYFELIYVPAIKDSTMRRYTVSNALSLMQICRGKVRLKMSRFAPLLFRQNFPPPFQLMLGWLFGLSESNAKAAVSTNGRAVLLHGGNISTASQQHGYLPKSKQCFHNVYLKSAMWAY